jgi:DNA polymerase-3 subunit gamma/tau
VVYEPLHHKYRPQTFADLVGQEAIATTLTNAINSKRIAPAYLFTGPRGTGKTSSARILAKSLNCLSSDRPTAEPCGQCEICRAIARGSALDVIEIDAASNTGVDNIREIIERSQFAPVQGRYKIYTIDECHMLSTAAFNALLKTLEEPPERVVFILATTDAQRVLPTIISRCQRFDYRRIPLDAMVTHLRKIADKESIEIEDEAITLVAQIANGGLRDAQSLLDQLSLLAGTVTPERVWNLVGSVAERDLLQLLYAIASDKAEAVIEQCRHLMNKGREPLVVLQNLAGFYLNLLVAKTAPNRSDLIAVTSSTWQDLCQTAPNWELNTILRGQQHLKDSEAQLKNTTQPRLWLEVTLLGLMPSAVASALPSQSSRDVSLSRRATPAPASSLPVTPPTVTPPPQAEKTSTPSLSPEPQPKIEPETEPKIEPAAKQEVSPTPEPKTLEAPSTANVTTDYVKIWQAVIEHLQPFMQTLARQHCQLVGLDDNSVCLGVTSEALLRLIKGKINDLEAAFKVVCRRSLKIHLQVGAMPLQQGSTNADTKAIVTPKTDETAKSEPKKEVEPTPVENPKEAITPPKEESACLQTSPTFIPISSSTQIKNNSNGSNGNNGSNGSNSKLKTRSEPISSPPLAPPTNEPDATAIADEDKDKNTVEEENELTRAAENLAKTFEGEIVPQEKFDLPTLPETANDANNANGDRSLSTPGIEPDDLDEEDEDDIPF